MELRLEIERDDNNFFKIRLIFTHFNLKIGVPNLKFVTNVIERISLK